jgi:hypothetical protein
VAAVLGFNTDLPAGPTRGSAITITITSSDIGNGTGE